MKHYLLTLNKLLIAVSLLMISHVQAKNIFVQNDNNLFITYTYHYGVAGANDGNASIDLPPWTETNVTIPDNCTWAIVTAQITDNRQGINAESTDIILVGAFEGVISHRPTAPGVQVKQISNSVSETDCNLHYMQRNETTGWAWKAPDEAAYTKIQALLGNNAPSAVLHQATNTRKVTQDTSIVKYKPNTRLPDYRTMVQQQIDSAVHSIAEMIVDLQRIMARYAV